MRAIQALIAVALVACGSEQTRAAYYDRSSGTMVHAPIKSAGIEIEQTKPVGDIGQSSQPLVFPKNGAGNPGIKPGSYRSCGQDPNQNCVVPRRPGRLVWFLYDGTSAQKTEVRTHVNQWIVDMRNAGLDECTAQRCWKFREATDLSDPELDLVIAISQSANACSGSAGTTRDLICWGGSTTGIAKDTNSGLFGTFHIFADHIVPVATLDYTQNQNTTGLTANQKYMRTRQAVRSILLGYGGKGLAIIGNSRCNNADLLALDEMCVESQSEVCWFENQGDAGNTDTVYRFDPQCGS